MEKTVKSSRMTDTDISTIKLLSSYKHTAIWYPVFQICTWHINPIRILVQYQLHRLLLNDIFSKLMLVKTRLSFTMNQCPLEPLMLLPSEQGIEINIDKANHKYSNYLKTKKYLLRGACIVQRIRIIND